MQSCCGPAKMKVISLNGRQKIFHAIGMEMMPMYLQ